MTLVRDATETSPGADRSSAYAKVAALLHESRRAAPDQLGSFLGRRVAGFGMQDLSVYVSDYEQRHLVPIPGSAETAPIDMEGSTGGRCFTTAHQVEVPADGGMRLWSVIVDGAARLGVMAVTFVEPGNEARSLADSLAGVVAALLVTRGQCTDAYTILRRTQAVTLAAEMQWDLLPPLSLDSGRVSVAGLIQPADEVGGDCFDYAVNGDALEFAVFDAMGHGLASSQLAHLAVSCYRHSRRSGLDLQATYEAMDAAVALTGHGEPARPCRPRARALDVLEPGDLVRGGEVVGRRAGSARTTAVLAPWAMGVDAQRPRPPRRPERRHHRLLVDLH